MGNRKVVSFPFGISFFILFAILLVILPILMSKAFTTLGFDMEMVIGLFFLTLFGSVINIPIHTIRTREKVKPTQSRFFFRLIHPETKKEYRIRKTTIAINLGGAIVPLFICAYLAIIHPELWWQYLTGIGITATICYTLARPIQGVGITLPILIPPLIAALIALLLPGNPATAIAYVSGVTGVLLGADLFNLAKVSEYRTKILSIGGAGTFDGIFLTGIISVILAA